MAQAAANPSSFSSSITSRGVDFLKRLLFNDSRTKSYFYSSSSSSFSLSATIYRTVPSLADRALDTDLKRIETDRVLTDTLKAFSLRLCEISYEVNQDEDALPELVRMGHLLQKVNSHRVYRENFRGLELVGVWVDGALWYHQKSDTLIAACRGTHTEEMNWMRDLGDGFVFGVNQLSLKMAEVIARFQVWIAFSYGEQ